MARKQDHSREVPRVRELSTPDGASKKIHWDDSAMMSYHSNAFNITVRREEILLEFGMQHAGDRGYSGEPVHTSNRIVMTPFTFKRLASSLEIVIQEYEARYDSPEIELPLPATGGMVQAPGKKGSFSGTKGAREKADFLFQLTNKLNVDIGFEPSFKISENVLLENRFLLGMNKSAIGQRPHERILDICERLEMPEDLLEIFREKLPDANYVHFGFEENEKACIYKVYLEFTSKIQREMNQETGQVALHLGLKWDASDPTKNVITTYTWHRWISIEDIIARVHEILDPWKHKTTIEIAESLVRLSATRIPYQDILYLEVTEAGNPRRSFDINVYRAGLEVGELYPLLSKMGQHYLIPYEKFHKVYEQARTKKFGHLSGGIDRKGNDFLTVYFGVENIPANRSGTDRFADELRLSAMQNRVSYSPQTTFSSELEEMDKEAGLLLSLLKDLNVPFGFERSFKCLPNTLLGDRFLSGFKRTAIKQNAHERILNICRQIDMPEDFLETFQKKLPLSNIVLFGFEKNKSNCLLKAYVEFADRIETAFQNISYKPEPFIIHEGFKWNSSDNSQKSVTTYTCFPLLTVEEILGRISFAYSGENKRRLFEILKGLLGFASTKAGPRDFLYVEAREENNPRMSFDINLYVADLRVQEIYPFLMEIIQYYSISVKDFIDLYGPLKNQKFGHLTAGIDREGQSFLTVYFSEKGSTRNIV